MPRKRTITFAASVFADLEAIRTCYTERQVSDAGNRLLEKIISPVERLADFPESGRIVPEFGITNLREIIHASFRIVYRLDGNRVRVLRIWRSKRMMKMPK